MITTATEPSPPDQRSVGVVLSGLNHLSLWRDRTVVIKYGGAAMGRAELRTAFARDVARLRAAGVHPVIVHGGGPQIDTLMRRLGKTPRFVDGLRAPDDETLELVEMVLVGRINPELVGLINQHGGHAIGLNGKDRSGRDSSRPGCTLTRTASPSCPAASRRTRGTVPSCTRWRVPLRRGRPLPYFFSSRLAWA
jgi:hypothetical protein